MKNFIKRHEPERQACDTPIKNSNAQDVITPFATKQNISYRISTVFMQLIIATFIMSNVVFAQAPYVHWQFTGESQQGGQRGEDWVYDIIETSDGASLSAGFSDIIEDYHLPSYIKLDANGNYLWDAIVSMSEPTLQGNFQVVKELDNGHFVMFGNKQKIVSTNPTVIADYLILHEIDATGNAVSGFPKLFLPNILPTAATMAFGFSLQLKKNGQGVVTGYTVAGLYRTSALPDSPNKGFIMEIDKNGQETGFLSKTIIDAGAEASLIRNHKNIYENGVHTGYILCGYVSDDNVENDAFLTKLTLSGTKVWEKRFTKIDLVGLGLYTDKYDYFGGTKELETGADSYYSACDSTQAFGYENNNEIGFDVVQTPDGNFVVNSYFDYYNCSLHNSAFINGVYTGEYLATDAVIIKVNTNGTPTRAENYRYFAGLDFYSKMQILENSVNPSDYHIVVMGNNPHLDENGVPIRMMGELLMLNNNGERQWYTQFNDNSREYCMFGLALTNDGGYLLAGNNEVDAVDINGPYITEKYIVIKLRHDCPPFDATALNITENTEWVIPMRLKQDVIVKQGAILTIKDVAYFSKDAHLIVEVGAKLVIEGGVLTNSCDSPTWPGVQVWGNSTGLQNPLAQGWVSMTNATIENAVTGVVANNYYTPDAWKTGYTGGIIMASGSVFKNCNIAVQFDPYDTYSVSFFSDCQFITNADYPVLWPAASSFDFAKISNHKGVQISNCSFTNDAPALFAMVNRGRGIVSTNGGFTVKNGCNFTGLYYGIYGLGILAQNTFWVKDAIFNTYRGIYMSAFHNNMITGNTFYVPVNVLGIDNNAYGLYMQSSTAYTVEDNVFTSNESTPTGIGLYINNSGTDNNEVYSNDFSNLQNSIIAQDINRNGNIGGLVIKCNTFTNTVSDIAVSTRLPFWTSNYGIAKNQGANSTDPTLMAGNLFYYNTTSTDYDDLNNGLSHFNYYYPLNTSGSESVNPLDFTLNTVTKQGTSVFPIWSYTNGCPNHTGGGGSGTLRSQMLTSGQQADSTANVLALLVDGGNTQQLTGEVQQSTPPQTVTMYNELMATSPYLSDSVVGQAIVKEDVLPNALLRDIMVANVHSAKSEILMNTLDSRANPMPDYMKAQVLQGRSLVSLKEETEARLGAYRLNEARALYGLSRQFMTDTLNPLASTDSLIGLLANANTLNAQYQLALLHLNRGEYTQGSDVLSNVPAHFALSAEELAMHQNMIAYYNWLVSIKQNQGNILYPDTAQQQQLWDIAMVDSSGAGVYARNLLVSLNETTYNEPILLPDMYKSTRAMEDYNKLLNSALPHFMKVFPNPASEYAIFEYQLESDVKATIHIQDVKGNTILSFETGNQQDQITVLTRDWVSGLYIAGLYINDKLIESTKFTVLK
jgi:hypothetical protein